MITAATTDPAPTARGEATRQAILRAAIERFGREGYRTTSVADIARDAEVGGTVPYAYFPNKEALFLAAIDTDAAGIISEGLATVATGSIGDWREPLVFSLVEGLDAHPLARRLLAGLEPEVTGRVLDIPALNDLRAAVADRIRAEQATGTVRPDIDPTAMGNGLIAIILSLLMSVTQVGGEAATAYAADVGRVFEAALSPPAPPR